MGPTPFPGSLLHRAAREFAKWALCVVLVLPAAWPYFMHFRHPPQPGLIPTGFIQGDMPYYFANARGHFDADGFHFFYSLPFSPNPQSPRLYSQPQSLLMALLWRVTSWGPAAVYLGFGAIAGLVCARIVLALFAKAVMPLGRDPVAWVALLMFFWGGGLLAAVGALRCWLGGHPWGDLFYFDPFAGLWFLNFGRNLIYPHEAFLHAVFFAAILAVLTRRMVLALALVACESWAHPFTGVELILILLTWALLERLWLERAPVPKVPGAGVSGEGDLAVPDWWVGGLFGVLAFHLFYYLVVLAMSPEHRELSRQWQLPWTYRAESFVPAYALVGALAAWPLRRWRLARQHLATPERRLYLVWFLVVFALSHHEFAIRPVQPLHFTRGYAWVALFFLGAATLIAVLRYLLAVRPHALGWAVCALLLAVMLSDNALWFSTYHARMSTTGEEFYLRPQVRDLLTFFNAPENRGALVLCEESKVGYLATAYTPLRAWSSHPLNTPGFTARQGELKDWDDNGRFLPQWDDRLLLQVCVRPPSEPQLRQMTLRGAGLVFREDPVQVYRIPAAHGRGSHE